MGWFSKKPTKKKDTKHKTVCAIFNVLFDYLWEVNFPAFAIHNEIRKVVDLMDVDEYVLLHKACVGDDDGKLLELSKALVLPRLLSDDDRIAEKIKEKEIKEYMKEHYPQRYINEEEE